MGYFLNDFSLQFQFIAQIPPMELEHDLSYHYMEAVVS